MDWKKNRSGERERVKWCLDFNPRIAYISRIEYPYYSIERKSKLRTSKPKRVVLRAGVKAQLWSSWIAWSRHQNLKLTALKDRSGLLRINGQAHYTDREERRHTFTQRCWLMIETTLTPSTVYSKRRQLLVSNPHNHQPTALLQTKPIQLQFNKIFLLSFYSPFSPSSSPSSPLFNTSTLHNQSPSHNSTNTTISMNYWPSPHSSTQVLNSTPFSHSLSSSSLHQPSQKTFFNPISLSISQLQWVQI